jgi:hypothetical protein
VPIIKLKKKNSKGVLIRKIERKPILYKTAPNWMKNEVLPFARAVINNGVKKVLSSRSVAKKPVFNASLKDK